MHPAKLAGPLPCAALGEGGPIMPRMTGAKFMVQMMQAYGVTHAFYMPMVVTKALVEMEKVGIRRIMTHGEKAAAYLAGSPVIAITGRRTPMQQYRHSYQEIDHIQPFAAVTKYNVLVDSAEQ